MLTLFRSKSLLSIIGLLVFTILIRLSTIFIPVSVHPTINTPFAQLVFDWLRSFGGFELKTNLIATLFVFFQALLVNYISSSHSILYKDSFLPAAFFVLLNSIYPEQLVLSPQLFANTFIILLLYRLCYLYESKIPLLLVFDAGILLGFGLLFSYDLIIYLPFILISVLYMTSFNFRYWMVAVFGIILPAYFLGVIFFLTNHLKDFIASFQYSLNKSYFNPIAIQFQQGLIWLVIIPVFIFSSFNIQLNFYRHKVKTRRIQLVILIMLLFGIISVFAENQSFMFGLCFLSVSLSFILSNFFISDKRWLMKEVTFYGLIFCAVYYQYFNH
ncbi:MAG: hypothetical protein H7296_00045 [Bacteroidia bacterium]|nr:hypothetical protein [Bacteroidia bacterium]